MTIALLNVSSWAFHISVAGELGGGRMRPQVLLWPVLAILGMSIWLTLSGNPIIWSTAAFACAQLVGWPAVPILKLTMAPFALIGIQGEAGGQRLRCWRPRL